MSARDVTDDPGLLPTELATAAGAPYVGAPGDGPLPRFARDAQLDCLLLELQSGFGPQQWWPAETPFEVAVGAVLTQNTAWRNVELALADLRAAELLTPARLLALPRADLEARVRPAGTFRVKAERLRSACEHWLAAGGLAPMLERPLEKVRAGWLAVHGVGPETADSILCYAAGRATPVVDAYARRVLERHRLVEPGLGYEPLRAWLDQRLLEDPRVHQEFHALVVRAGYGHCKPTPRCETCPAATPPGVEAL